MRSTKPTATKPRSVPMDALLTIPQFAAWRQIAESTARAQIKAGMPGVIKRSREDIQIHPRTYLEVSLGRKI